MSIKFKTISVSNEGSRNDLRKRVVNIFFEEEHGEGGGDLASKYIYYVEELIDGNRIYLSRPAHLKKGFDFLIHVENIDFSKGRKYRDYPKHSDLLDDLNLKLRLDNNLYLILLEEINYTFNCHEINEDRIRKLIFQKGYSSELVVKVLKWFFIEQDIRDWNYSGRKMLFNALPKIVI